MNDRGVHVRALRKNQRAIPIALIVLALALIAGRVALSLTKREPLKTGLIRWVEPAEAVRFAAATDKAIERVMEQVR